MHMGEAKSDERIGGEGEGEWEGVEGGGNKMHVLVECVVNVLGV